MIRASITRPAEVAALGEEIYANRYRDELEPSHAGHFVAIDVYSQRAFVREFAEDAVEDALDSLQAPLLHLVQVGASSAFAVSHLLTR